MTASSIVLALAPKCPICFLAYFGIFGVATSFASVYRVWLPPLTVVWLVLTIGTLFFRPGAQHRYGPGLLGIFGGFAVLVGRFVVDYRALVYGGIAALLAAVVWRTWSRRLSTELCAQCEELPLIHDNQPRVSGP